MYVCGITPYDATHLGHAATYLTFDLVYRIWLDNGHEVHYVQNITDVDDPLFERANRDGIDWRDLGRAGDRSCSATDMAALRVLPPRDYVAATDAIAEVVELVEKLLASGAAYVVDDPEFPDVYFRADATAQFGYESGYDRDTMMRLFAERGGDPDRPGKADPLDALLWRAARPRRAELAVAVRPRPPGLARRVCGNLFGPHRFRPRRPGRRQRPDLPAPRVLGRARRMCHRRAPIRPALRACRDDRLGRPQDVQEPRQPGVGVAAARRRASIRRRSGWVCSPGTTALTGSGATRCSTRPTPGCTAGAAPPRCPPVRTPPTSSPGCATIWPTTSTPRKALAAVDGWSTDALEYGGHDPSLAGRGGGGGRRTARVSPL